MKRIIALLLAMLMLGTLYTGALAAEMTDGVYVGQGKGFGGNIEVTVTIEGGKITATLGSDLDPAMPGACIVSKRYLAGGGLTGSVALIGSTRMEYERLLPILDYFAARMGQSMAGQGQ